MSSSPPYDVVIIGAGLSGLQAAVTAHQNGLKCLVLEATDRIGGKVLSVPYSSGSAFTVDLGPAWINNTTQSYMFALGEKYGADFQVQHEEGDEIFQNKEGQVVRQPRGTIEGTAEEQQRIFELVVTIDEICKKLRKEDFRGPLSEALDKDDFATWIGQQTNNFEPALLLMNLLVKALVGVEANEAGALPMLKLIESAGGFWEIAGTSKDCGQYLRPVQGCQIFVNGLASELPPNTIQISSPVETITQEANACIVTTREGTSYEAKRVIVSVPTGLYRHITFTPALPSAKRVLSANTNLGYYTKLVATYDKPWWRAASLSGEAHSLTDKGPITMVMDTSVDSQPQYSLSLFIVGESGRAWSVLTSEDRRHTVLQHLRRLFGPFVPETDLPEPTNLHELDWLKEQWFEGAPSSVYPHGLLTAAGSALKEVFGHLHFVGTEMSDVWEGYMEGAVREGERGALEVVKALRG